MTTLIGRASSKSNGSDSLAAYPEHEVLTAERMKWWGVFLLREKRRLQGIAEAVQGNGHNVNESPSADDSAAGVNGYISSVTMQYSWFAQRARLLAGRVVWYPLPNYLRAGRDAEGACGRGAPGLAFGKMSNWLIKSGPVFGRPARIACMRWSPLDQARIGE